MENKFTVLIIEDEKNIADFMEKMLPKHEYRVIVASTGKKGLEVIFSQCPDIILLDLGLPDMDGREIIEKVREYSKCPIIVVSARNQEKEKVLVLDLGADDYITKPFGTQELLARIRTALRRSNMMNSENALMNQLYKHEGLSIDFEKRLVVLEEEKIHLTPVEYRIVAYLAQNAGKVVTYSAIISNVWGPYAEADNTILRVNMANIRRKLEKNPADPKHINTEIGIGYRMAEDSQS